MKSRKAPERTCVGCGEKKDKKDLVRIVRTKEGVIALDATGKKNGRGAYICPDSECLLKAKKNHGLERSFKQAVPEEVFAVLNKEMEALHDR